MPISNLKSSIKHIILDFGGVLFDIDYDAPVRAFAKLGYSEFDKIYTKSAQSELIDGLETGRYGKKELVDAARPLVRADVSDQEIVDAWNAILLGIPSYRIKFLHRLKEHYNLYLLSNTNALHVEAFEMVVDDTMGLAYFKSAFKEVYYSNVIGIKKPDPATFRTICEWNHLLPEECLFIDDSIQHVEGARKAGLKAYFLNVEDITVALQPLLT